MVLLPRETHLLASSTATTAITTGTLVKHICWLHKFPMSLWLSTPAISIADLQAILFESVQFPSHSAMFIFLWTVFVTAVVLLILAVGATLRTHSHHTNAPFPGSRLRSPSLWGVKLGDEERGDLMLRVGVDGVAGEKGY